METQELLRTFIVEEEKELNKELANRSGEQGHNFLSENYSALVKAFPKAVKLLEPQELEPFYFHYIRRGLLPLKGIEKTYALWETAYRKQSIFLDKKKYDTFFPIGPRSKVCLFLDLIINSNWIEITVMTIMSDTVPFSKR